MSIRSWLWAAIGCRSSTSCFGLWIAGMKRILSCFLLRKWVIPLTVPCRCSGILNMMGFVPVPLFLAFEDHVESVSDDTPALLFCVHSSSRIYKLPVSKEFPKTFQQTTNISHPIPVFYSKNRIKYEIHYQPIQSLLALLSKGGTSISILLSFSICSFRLLIRYDISNCLTS